MQIVQPIQPPLRTGQEMEPNKKILVDKICRLQRIHAKKNEKLEFMEEHINALVEEIQKKARLVIPSHLIPSHSIPSLAIQCNAIAMHLSIFSFEPHNLYNASSNVLQLISFPCFRIIQFYALREQSGALAPPTSDVNKVSIPSMYDDA